MTAQPTTRNEELRIAINKLASGKPLATHAWKQRAVSMVKQVADGDLAAEEQGIAVVRSESMKAPIISWLKAVRFAKFSYLRHLV